MSSASNNSTINAINTAALAAEYAQSADSQAVEWSTVPELIEFTAEIQVSAYDPATHEVVTAPKSMTFEQICDSLADIRDQKSRLETREKALRENLQVAVMGAGRDKVICHGLRLSMVTKAGAKKIVPEKLVKLGVSPETIAAATEIGKPSSYLDVREVKAAKAAGKGE